MNQPETEQNYAIVVLEQQQEMLKAEKQRIIASIVTPYDLEIEKALKSINLKLRQIRGSLYILNSKIQAA